MNPEDFINKIKPHARKIQDKYDIPAPVIIAQAALESGWGRHIPHDKNNKESSNNIFGVKHHGSEKYDYVVSDTTEYVNGRWITEESKFRKYESWYESLEDYASFLIKNNRYEKSFEHADDPYRFAVELQKAGYATDPEYANKLISIINQYDLVKKLA